MTSADGTTNDVLEKVLGELETLRADNASLRDENRSLADRLDALDGQTESRALRHARDGRDDETTGLSRRGLLKRMAGASALGVGVLTVGDVFAPRAAHAAAGQDMVLGAANSAGTAQTSLSSNPAFVRNANTAVLNVIQGPSGIVDLESAIIGDGADVDGVVGLSHSSTGVRGIAGGSSGVEVPPDGGRATEGAVVGDTATAHYAVVGTSSVGTAVYGVAFGSADVSGAPPVAAVVGDSNSTTSPAILGRTSGEVAVLGQINQASDSHPAVAGDTAGAGPGISGISASGRGGSFQGGNKGAAVRLVPASAASHPASGARGDLFVDHSGRLWFCTHGGTTATWKQLA